MIRLRFAGYRRRDTSCHGRVTPSRCAGSEPPLTPGRPLMNSNSTAPRRRGRWGRVATVGLAATTAVMLVAASAQAIPPGDEDPLPPPTGNLSISGRVSLSGCPGVSPDRVTVFAVSTNPLSGGAGPIRPAPTAATPSRSFLTGRTTSSPGSLPESARTARGAPRPSGCWRRGRASTSPTGPEPGAARAGDADRQCAQLRRAGHRPSPRQLRTDARPEPPARQRFVPALGRRQLPVQPPRDPVRPRLRAALP